MIKLKYSVSGRQPLSVMKEADEIRIAYKDYDYILDLIQKIPEKTFIIDMFDVKTVDEVNWERLEFYNTQVKIIICLYNLKNGIYDKCKEMGLRFYWGFAINSFYKLHAILDLHPAYVYIDAPLSFDLEKVKKWTGSTQVRMCPNLAYTDGLPRENGIRGQFVRPEDVDKYEPYIDVFDFNFKDLRREGSLLSIYKDGIWPDDLNYIIDNLNVSVDNAIIPKEFGEYRLTCAQRCMANGACHFCNSTIRFAQSLRSHKLKENS